MIEIMHMQDEKNLPPQKNKAETTILQKQGA